MAGRIRPLLSTVTALLAVLASADPARAGCNTIPPASRTFVSTRGVVDRALAGPRDTVMITLRPECLPNPLPIGQRDHFQAGDRVVIHFTVELGPSPGPTPMPLMGAKVAVDPFDDHVLRFDVPNAVAPPGRPFGVAGPVRITVDDGAGNTIAQIDALNQPTVGCDTIPESMFRQFTLLPEANDFDRKDTDDDVVLMTLDGGENILIPFRHKQKPVTPRGPAAHLQRGAGHFRAFSAKPDKIGQVLATAKAGGAKDSELVQAFSREGFPLPPVVSVDGSGALFGTTDAEISVIRIARRSGLYDLTDRVTAVQDDLGVTHAGIGPIVMDNTQGGRKFKVNRCKHPALLSGIKPASRVTALTTDENFPAVGELNGDGKLDMVPEVLTIAQGGQKCPDTTKVPVAGRVTPTSTIPLLDAHVGLTAMVRTDDTLRVVDADGADITPTVGAIDVSRDAVLNGGPLVVAAPFVFFREPASGGGTPVLKLVNTSGIPSVVSPNPSIAARAAVIDPAARTAAARTDAVAQFYDADTNAVLSLTYAVEKLALSDHLVAMTVPESSLGSSGNNDGDTNDTVLMLAAVNPPVAPTPTGLGVAADDVAISVVAGQKWVVFVTPESAEGSAGLDCVATTAPGGCDLNGDGDAADRVLRAYNLATTQRITIGQAEDFVVGGALIAYRAKEITPPPPAGTATPVMTAYDLAATTPRRIRIDVPAARCERDGYEWMHPYAVRNRNIYFLGREPGGPGKDVLVIVNVDTLGFQALAVQVGPTLPPLTMTTIDGTPMIGVATTTDQPSTLFGDRDGDGMLDAFDHCIDAPDRSSFDDDLDGLGTACDANLCTPFRIPVVAPPADDERTALVVRAVRTYIAERAKATTDCLVNVSGDPHAPADHPTERCRGYYVGSAEVRPEDPATAAEVARAAEVFLRDLRKADPGIERAREARLLQHATEAAIAVSHAAFGDDTTRADPSCPEALAQWVLIDLDTVFTKVAAFLAAPPAQDTLVKTPDRKLSLTSAVTLPDPAPLTGCNPQDLARLDACGRDGRAVTQCVRCVVLRRAVDALVEVYAPPALPHGPP
ncbi:MAG: hypothetical protein IT293_10690 [Deltaproteobacteria bacterium]|nr:hypothetical protein [Deltaproteobacteria bacterium]